MNNLLHILKPLRLNSSTDAQTLMQTSRTLKIKPTQRGSYYNIGNADHNRKLFKTKIFSSTNKIKLQISIDEIAFLNLQALNLSLQILAQKVSKKIG